MRLSAGPREFKRPLVWLNLPSNLTERTQQQVAATPLASGGQGTPFSLSPQTPFLIFDFLISPIFLFYYRSHIVLFPCTRGIPLFFFDFIPWKPTGTWPRDRCGRAQLVFYTTTSLVLCYSFTPVVSGFSPPRTTWRCISIQPVSPYSPIVDETTHRLTSTDDKRRRSRITDNAKPAN